MALVKDMGAVSPEDFENCDKSKRLQSTDPTWPWYKVILNEVFDDHEDNRITILRFQVVRGLKTSIVVEDKLYDPSYASDDAKAEDLRRRYRAFQRRLGILTPEMVAAGNTACNLEDALGREYVIKVHEKPKQFNTGKTDAKSGKQIWENDPSGIIYVNLDFYGVYPLSHYEIPDELRGKDDLDLPPAVVPDEIQSARDRAAAREANKSGAAGAAGKAPRSPRKTTAKAEAGTAAGVAGTGQAGPATGQSAPPPAAAVTSAAAAVAVQHDFSDL
jgi:hypothetical protein